MIALTSDTHVGITPKDSVEKMFRKLAKKEFDVLVHAGDYSGDKVGAPAVEWTVKSMRRHFPNKPILSVLGNHDFWANRPSSLEKFNANYSAIRQVFKDNNVHFLDHDGPFIWEQYQFVGNTGWYTFPNPPTNDLNFLPAALGGDTHRHLLQRAQHQVEAQLKGLQANKYPIFVSHFPVINSVADHKGSFNQFCWASGWGDFLQQHYGIKAFLNGHAHKLCKGPLRWEAGSDYYNPKVILIDADKEFRR